MLLYFERCNKLNTRSVRHTKTLIYALEKQINGNHKITEGGNFLDETYEFKAVSHLISRVPIYGTIIPLAASSLHLGGSSTRVAWHIPLSRLHKIDVNGETHCQSLPGKGTLEPA